MSIKRMVAIDRLQKFWERKGLQLQRSLGPVAGISPLQQLSEKTSEWFARQHTLFWHRLCTSTSPLSGDLAGTRPEV